MYGVLLAGGTGTRLWPSTLAISKQLIPIFNKPMIYYSLSTLLLAGARKIFVVVTEDNRAAYGRLLGDGKELGIELHYVIQDAPDGIAQAVDLVPTNSRTGKLVLGLGDNIFYGGAVGSSLSLRASEGALAFGCRVSNPSDFGVVEIDQTGSPVRLVEKPAHYVSNLAIPGLYFFDETVFERVKSIKPSDRGELEITDLLTTYLSDGLLTIEELPRGTAWLDTGKADSLARASQFVEAVESNQGVLVGSPHEIAWRQGWISSSELATICERSQTSDYGQKLSRLLHS